MKSPFSLYVHIPFCVQKCPYCDFNSYGLKEFLNKRLGTDQSGELEATYTDALIRELTSYTEEPTWSGRECRTVFFGGGTPSLFSAKSISRILESLQSRCGLAADAEITLEANPGTIGEELGEKKLREFRAAGVNRISMGAQSFNPEKLKFLGRIHTAGDTAAAVANVRRAGFDNFNLDLIFGIENETIALWRSDIARVLELQPKHISTYGLTIEPGTEFGKSAKKGSVLTCSEELQAEMYQLACSLLPQAGYLQYEISNFAQTGHECRHNLVYWERGDYLGLGAGAHSFYRNGDHSDARWSNIPGPLHYIERITSGGTAGGTARQCEEEVSEEEAKFEFFFLGLRRNQGVSDATYRDLFGSSFLKDYGSVIEKLAAQGLITQTEEQLSLTSQGFLFANTVFEHFVA